MILVTGAGGTVGSEVVKRLQEAKVPLRAAFNSAEKAARAKAAGIPSIVLDFERPPTIAAALDNVDKVFLLSPAMRNEMETRLLDPARAARGAHLVKLSVWAAASGAFSFARMHRAIEKKIEASGLPWTFLRPNGFMQNYLGLAPAMRRGTFALPGSDARAGLIDVRDIAAVAAAVLTEGDHLGKAYDLSGPEALSNAEIALKLSEAAGRTIRHVAVSEDEYRAALVRGGAPEALADAVTDLQRYYGTGAAARLTPEVERLTGRRPITFDQFARDHAAAFR